MAGLMIPPRWQTDPAEAGKIAVLCGDELYTFANQNPLATVPDGSGDWPLVFDGGVERLGEDISLTGLLIGLLADGVETLMLVPSCGETFGESDHPLLRAWPKNALPETLEYESAGELKVHPLSSRSFGLSTLGGLVAQFASGGPLLSVYGPDALTGWGIFGGNLREHIHIPWYRARVLASAWLAVSYALNQRLRFSASYSGLALMRQHLRAASERLDLAQPSADYARLIQEAQAHPLSWARPLLVEEPTRVLSYDRNFSWISSAREVPVGDPEPVSAFQPNTPGVYFVAITPPFGLDTALLPGPVCEHGRWVHETRGAWAWEPTLRYAARVGYRIEVLSGYAWPKTRRVDLRGWQDALWNARRTLAALQISPRYLAPSIGYAGEQLVKAMGRAAIGRLNQRRGYELRSLTEIAPDELRHLDVGDHGELTGLGEVEAPLGRSDLVRPEWWSTIVSSANERLLSQAYTYHQTHGALCAFFDGLYLLRIAPELDGSPLKCGGWHFEHDALVPPAALRPGKAAVVVRACNDAPEYRASFLAQ